ncbi:hypothetical protein F4813DRAFT_245825 [Daldinia decipiens]|uniref:uncharacterized protein n=1 Tax=Daldinia decipiens TaxID=326647 RepID=UPI0020C44439|nr:uncharacterized protein F4813DRAFT_245825 [Daldinia decipiens]KAI1653788.1 hypothetical protein F4813DRAFT_245825 [Daldinia decipiens]
MWHARREYVLMYNIWWENMKTIVIISIRDEDGGSIGNVYRVNVDAAGIRRHAYRLN